MQERLWESRWKKQRRIPAKPTGETWGIAYGLRRNLDVAIAGEAIGSTSGSHWFERSTAHPPGRRFFRDRGLAGVSVGKEVETMSQPPFQVTIEEARWRQRCVQIGEGVRELVLRQRKRRARKRRAGAGGTPGSRAAACLPREPRMRSSLFSQSASRSVRVVRPRADRVRSRRSLKRLGQSRPRHAGCRVCRVCDLAFHPGLCRARG